MSQLTLIGAVLAVLFFSKTVQAQHDVQRDTSYTIYSTYIKLRKTYPEITVVNQSLPDGVSCKRDIVYMRAGGRALHADIYYPAGKAKSTHPGVLLINGGGWRSGDKSQSRAIAQELAAKGYIAVCAEYRLSLEAKYPKAVYDLKAAIRWMRANAITYHLKKDKIVVMGFSAGGQLAALIGTTNGVARFEGMSGNLKQSSAVQAIVDVDGVLAFKHPESAEGETAAFWLGGNYAQKPEIWEEASPLNHTGKKTPPILFINSSIPRFHAGRDDMIKKLSNWGIYTEVHTLPGSPHSFWFFNPWFDPVIKYTVGFLGTVLTTNHD